MMIDARFLNQNKIIETDICIVGGGLAGITLTKELIGAKLGVSLVESGGEKPDRKTQNLQWGENVGHPYYSLDTSRPRFLGGSLNRWHLAVEEDCSYARMRQLDSIDFEKRDWIPYSGWPFEKSHLDSFYERAQAVCSVNPPTFDVDCWQNKPNGTQQVLCSDRIQTVIFKFGSKKAFLRNHLNEIDRANNVATYIHANAVEIETDSVSNTVSKLKIITENGNLLWVKAKVYVIASGAIEIARLLLVSNKNRKTGLGNEYGLVGRFFMEHPHFTAGILLPANPDIFKSTHLYTKRNIVNGIPIIGKIALAENLIRENKILGHVIELYPKIIPRALLHRFPIVDNEGVSSIKALRQSRDERSEIGKHLHSICRNIDDVGLAVYRQLKSRLYNMIDKTTVKVFSIQSMSEQIPNPESRVFLSDERDALGMNRVKLDWKISSEDMRSIIKTLEILDRDFRRLGIGKIYRQLYNEIPNENIYGGWHHMGTTRMNADPRSGVVDENSKVHSIKNLYIAGPSVFPTGGYANPALTIVALSIRLADHLKKILN